MLSKPIKARDITVDVFTSGEYGGDVETFQDAVNSWLKSQPDNAVVKDIIYQHPGINSHGKDIFSVAIISRPSTERD